MSRNEVKFWTLLFTLNFVLFLPGYLLNGDAGQFFPFRGILHGSIYERCKSVFVRQDMDIFRISVDLFVLVFMYYLLRNHINYRLYGCLSGIYYILILSFLIYYHTVEKIYHIPPQILNDMSLLKLGFFNIGDQSVTRSVLIMLPVLTVLALLVWAVMKLTVYTRDIVPGVYSKTILWVLGLLMSVNTLKSGITSTPEHTFQETFALMGGSIKSSSDARKNLRNFTVEVINKELNYNSFTLGSKPDIYLIFLESYGRILFEDPYLSNTFIKCLDSCSLVLSGHGWNMASGFSISPVSGGKSWISYTSVMFGFNIRNQGTYNAMLKDPSITGYDNIFRVLHNNGYKTFRLNAMPENPDMKMTLESYSRFYSIDHWINFRDLQYTGRLYGFGPSPPDQYSINFADEYIRKSHTKPFALFFITQTTHHPFHSPDTIVADWRSLNYDRDSSIHHAMAFLKKPTIVDYRKAVCYDVRTLTQFISTKTNNNAIFLIIGDHQPPFFTGNQAGFETPVHIICRNREFTEAFYKYGLLEGLKPDLDAVPIHHEGIYSMFMRELIRLYGDYSGGLPEYRPYGILVN